LVVSYESVLRVALRIGRNSLSFQPLSQTLRRERVIALLTQVLGGLGNRIAALAETGGRVTEDEQEPSLTAAGVKSIELVGDLVKR
jgi:hypothetical protein